MVIQFLKCDSIKAYGIRVNIAVYITTNCQFLLVKKKLTVCSPRTEKDGGYKEDK
jgi:hypothetical protein